MKLISKPLIWNPSVSWSVNRIIPPYRNSSTDLLDSPLDSLYTPFSILLAYEVYQLIRAIPESFSTAVGKQFEIVTLLVVRDIFKRLSEVQVDGDWVIDTDLKLIIVECFTIFPTFTGSRAQQSHYNIRYLLWNLQIITQGD